MKKGDVISVAVFGRKIDSLSSNYISDYEQCEYRIISCEKNDNISDLIIRENPNVFLSFGEWQEYENLSSAPFEVRSRWLNYNHDADLGLVGQDILKCYIKNTLDEPRPEEPLVSLITPSYNIATRIFKTYESLSRQTYKNWEWIILDDSTDNNKTYNVLQSMSAADHRIKVFKNSRHNGIIGNTKRNAFSLGNGEYLAELDHDDELTDRCLEWVVKTFKKYPEAGMCYTDCSELIESTGDCVCYGETYAFGYGSYRKEQYKGREWLVSNYPKLNAKTVRHIVGVPNHIRVWRKNVYHSLGGHNHKLHVVDDYELILRTFLYSKIAYIPKFGYIQHMLDDRPNTTDIRRKEIQRLVRYVRDYYDRMIHEKIIELGGTDFVWDKENKCSNMHTQQDKTEEYFCIISDVE